MVPYYPRPCTLGAFTREEMLQRGRFLSFFISRRRRIFSSNMLWWMAGINIGCNVHGYVCSGGAWMSVRCRAKHIGIIGELVTSRCLSTHHAARLSPIDTPAHLCKAVQRRIWEAQDRMRSHIHACRPAAAACLGNFPSISNSLYFLVWMKYKCISGNYEAAWLMSERHWRFLL